MSSKGKCCLADFLRDYKARSFILNALKLQQAEWSKALKEGHLDEDKQAEIGNDLLYLEMIIHNIEETRS